MQKNENNCKKMNKTRVFEYTAKPSLLLEEPPFSGTLIWRNEPNFNTSNIIATSYITVGYNDFFQNSTKKTNPIKANLKPISSITKPSLLLGEPPFSSTLICKNKPNYEHLDVNITVCKKKVYKGFSLKIYQKNKPKTNPNKPNLKPISEMENLQLPKNKKNGKRTQFRQPNSTANSCNKVTYNALQPKGNEPKRTQLKPIKANFKKGETAVFG